MTREDPAVGRAVRARLADVAIGAPVTLDDVAAIQAMVREVAPDGASVEAWHRPAGRGAPGRAREVAVDVRAGGRSLCLHVLPVA